MDHEQGLVPGVPIPPAHHEHHWPEHADEITWPARPESVPAARAHARQVLRFWNVGPEMRQDVELVVSELMTNAIAASADLEPARPVHLALFAGPGWLMTVVADASPRSPVLLHPDGEAKHGRGLQLVEALSSRWGWHEANWRRMVKVCWAEWARD